MPQIIQRSAWKQTTAIKKKKLPQPRPHWNLNDSENTVKVKTSMEGGSGTGPIERYISEHDALKRKLYSMTSALLTWIKRLKTQEGDQKITNIMETIERSAHFISRLIDIYYYTLQSAEKLLDTITAKLVCRIYLAWALDGSLRKSEELQLRCSSKSQLKSQGKLNL